MIDNEVVVMARVGVEEWRCTVRWRGKTNALRDAEKSMNGTNEVCQCKNAAWLFVVIKQCRLGLVEKK